MAMDNQTSVSIKFANSITNQSKLEQYKQQLLVINSVLKGMDSGTLKSIEKGAKYTKNIDDEVGNVGKKVSMAFNYGVVTKFANGLKNVYTSLVRLANASNDYLEDINLFQVAFHNNYTEAERFVNKLSEMYGLDERWLTRTVGIFKQLSNAMRLSNEEGTKLSTLMTQMSIDISSLYNLDINKASSVLQSALAGQTKPIRGATGADITVATLQQSLSNLGIDKYVNDLNYAEKRLLIIISLTQQLKETTNDFGRTIEQPANQMRILNEQWERLSRAVGNLFMPTLKAILPYLNGIVMALTEILSFVGTLLGINIDDYVADVSGVADSVLDLEDGLDGANESAKKLKQGLRGFDKLNVITTPKDTGATSGTGAGISADIMDAFNKAFDDYNRQLTNVQMKATKIRDSILEWLGFTKEIDPVTGKVSFKYTGIKTTLKNMWNTFKGMTPLGKALTGVFGYLFGKNIINNITKINKLLGKTGTIGLFKKLNSPIKELLTSLNNVNIAEKNLNGGLTTATNNWAKQLSVVDRLKLTLMGTGGLIVGYTLLSSSIKSASEEGWNLSNVLGTVGGTLSNIAGGALIGSNFGTIGIVIGGVTGAFLSLIEAIDSTETETDKLIEKSQAHSKLIKDYGNAVEETYNQIEAGVKRNMAVHENNENLFKELQRLVDSNGNILVGYEDRVKFILNELKNAYGVEYTIVGNQIQQYDNYIKKTQELINQKKIEAIISGKTEAYGKAVTNRAELLDKMADQKDILDKLNNEMKKEQQNMEKLTQQYTRGEISHLQYSTGIENSRNKIAKLNGEYVKAKETYDEYKDTVAKNEKIISDYSILLEAQISGDSEKINKSIEKTSDTYVRNGEIVSSDIDKRIKRLDIQYNELHSITKEEYESQIESLAETLIAMSNNITDMTPEIVKGWGNLAETSTDKFLEYFKKVPTGLQQNVIDKMQDQGYKISDELQKGINKINPTITFDANTTKVDAKINNLKDRITKGLGGLLSGGYGGSMGGRAKGGVFANNKWHDIKMYSDGLNAGLPPVGQMFVAREKGPELVGTLGGHTAVMNNNQIVGSVSDGVARAVRSVLGTSQQPRGQQIFNIYLDEDHKLGSYTLEQLQDMAISNGEKITIG